MPYVLENMEPGDISDVARIERLCFSMPWPTSAYRRELKTPDTNRYIVVRFVPPEMATSLGLPLPTEENLSLLTHPKLQLPENGRPRTDSPEGSHRSLLTTLLPWLRNGSGKPPPSAKSSRFPV